jgi:hypothetical protein
MVLKKNRSKSLVLYWVAKHFGSCRPTEPAERHPINNKHKIKNMKKTAIAIIHHNRKSIPPLVAVAALLAMVSTSHAQLIAYDGFNYTANATLASANGGTGWSGAWSSVSGGTVDVLNPGLTFGSLETEGNRGVITPTSATTFSTRTLGTTLDTGTRYLSFLAQNTNGGTRGAGIVLRSSTGEIGFVGQLNGTSTWGISQGSTSTSTSFSSSSLSLLVLKIEFNYSGTFDRLSLAINPTPGGAEPGTYDAVIEGVDITTLSALRLQAGFTSGSVTTTIIGIDEIRVGTTFADVTPIPEPSAMALLLGGLVAILTLRKRRSSARC